MPEQRSIGAVDLTCPSIGDRICLRLDVRDIDTLGAHDVAQLLMVELRHLPHLARAREPHVEVDLELPHGLLHVARVAPQIVQRALDVGVLLAVGEPAAGGLDRRIALAPVRDDPRRGIAVAVLDVVPGVARRDRNIEAHVRRVAVEVVVRVLQLVEPRGVRAGELLPARRQLRVRLVGLVGLADIAEVIVKLGCCAAALETPPRETASA